MEDYLCLRCFNKYYKQYYYEYNICKRLIDKDDIIKVNERKICKDCLGELKKIKIFYNKIH